MKPFQFHDLIPLSFEATQAAFTDLLKQSNACPQCLSSNEKICFVSTPTNPAHFAVACLSCEFIGPYCGYL